METWANVSTIGSNSLASFRPARSDPAVTDVWQWWVIYNLCICLISKFLLVGWLPFLQLRLGRVANSVLWSLFHELSHTGINQTVRECNAVSHSSYVSYQLPPGLMRRMLTRLSSAVSPDQAMDTKGVQMDIIMQIYRYSGIIRCAGAPINLHGKHL